MHQLISDVRYALRILLRSPGFTLIAILALALGIGANTAIFSAVDAILLRPLPYPDADRLVMVWEDASHVSFPRNTPAPANYFDWKKQNTVFVDMAALRGRSANLTGDGAPELVQGRTVTPNFFSVLGVQPVLGHAFTAEDDKAGAKVVVLSYGLWQRRYGGDRSIIGRAIQMNGEPYTVVGVTPQSFNFPDRLTSFFWPATLDSAATVRGSHYLNVVARLKPGVSLQSASTEMKTIARRLETQYPGTNTHIGAVVVPLREQIAGDVRTALFVLLGAAGCVLLIACSNVANLLLARATGRQRELAVRSALGAGRTRLVRQMLTESLVLAALGGSVGIAAGYAGTRLLEALVPSGFPAGALAMDAPVLLFSLAATALTALVFGLLPALSSTRVALNDALKQASRAGVGGRNRWMRNGLVVSEVALAIVLLTGAGLMIQTLHNLRTAEPGFRSDHLLTLRLLLPAAKYPKQEQRMAFYEAALQHVRTLPGVRSAAFAGNLPFTATGNTNGYAVDGRPAPQPGDAQDALYRPVTRDYFSTIGATLLQGRFFTVEDHARSTHVIVINDHFARLHWGTQSPLGGRIRFGRGEDEVFTIIGVVKDIRERGLDLPMKPASYLLMDQENADPGAFLAVRTETDPSSLSKAVVEAIWAVDKNQPVSLIRTMDAVIDAQFEKRGLQMTLLSIFAGLALALACLGIYGVLSYLVTQRVREVGLRMALGATASEITMLFVRPALGLTAIGVAAGVVVSAIAGRAMQTMLFEITPADPRTHAGVAAVVLLVAMVACYVPARRASRVDPMVALREE